MSPDIYYMCRNQMEAPHSSQQRVTEVTCLPHEKRLPLPSMNAGLSIHNEQTLCWSRVHPSICLSPTVFFPSTFPSFFFFFYQTSCSVARLGRSSCSTTQKGDSDTRSPIYQSPSSAPSVTMKRFHNTARQKLIPPVIHHAQPSGRSTDLIGDAWLRAGHFVKPLLIRSS